ncbi:MAG: alpha/beta fold hydrolase [Betaproteobacteria bacterium]|nr:alpha/beta fold hydrolase [Betaproteobacteria bacterium]
MSSRSDAESDSPESTAPDWFGDADALSPDALASALRDWALAPGPDASGYFELLGRLLREQPEALQRLQENLFAGQLTLWRSLLEQEDRDADPSSGVAHTNQPTPHLPDLPWFRLVRGQHELWRDWARGLTALMEPTRKSERRAAFALRQWVEGTDPRNFFATNPGAIQRAIESRGESVRQGLANLARDVAHGRVTMSDDTGIRPGSGLAVTEGAVIHESPIAQLIHYAPRTERVRHRPLLVIPPFINRYYVLDLRPDTSFVRFMLDQGFQVFLVSWRNACDETAGSTWADYVRHGVLEPARVCMQATASRRFNLLGYCVGGTLAATAAAVLPHGARALGSLSLLTTLLDFEDPGEIGVYIDDARARRFEEEAGKGGRMRGTHLAAAFSSLRARELLWHFVEHNYLLGETPPALDLLHWNNDSVDVPGPLFAQYLRGMYLENRLAEPGAFTVDDRPVDLGTIRVPAYLLGAVKDHIVPWQSVYASARLLGGPRRFVLTDSGHIAGVVNPPGAAHARGYRVDGDVAPTPEEWFDEARYVKGSWWQDWASWLHAVSGRWQPAGDWHGRVRSAMIEPAPGRYVGESSQA